MAQSLSPELGFHSHTLLPPLVMRDGMEGDGATAPPSPASSSSPIWLRENGGALRSASGLIYSGG